MRTNTRKMGPLLSRAGKGFGLLSAVILPLAILCAAEPATQRAAAGVSTRANTGTNWSQFHRHNMVRWNPGERILNVKTVRKLTLRWRFSLGPVATSPVVANGVAYIGSGRGVYALDAESGTKLWSFAADSMVWSPAVAYGLVFIGSEDGWLYALNASAGTLTWKRQIGSSIGDAISAPAAEKGIIYVGVGKYDGATIYALHAKTGRKVWTYEGGWINTEGAIANGIVYFGELGGGFDAFDANTGVQLWGAYLDASPAVTNGVVYVGGDALDARTGALLWSSGVRAFVAPAVANGVVYFAADSLYALDAKTGAKLWRRPLSFQYSESSPAVAGGVVYVGSDDHSLDAFNAKSGNMLWSYRTGDVVISSPVVVNGMVYVGSLDGKLYAFGLKK